jgi:Tfp pilus assembly protein PilF
MPSHRSQQKNKGRAARANRTWICAAVIGVVTAIAFLPALQNGFVNYDDDRLLLHNPYLRLPWKDQLEWMWSTTFLGHYQPLTWLSLSIDHALAGLAAFAYHLDSLLWHTAAALLLYGVLVTLLERADPIGAADARHLRVCAAAGALFWSIHPLRVESVAWVAERRDLVSIVFLLLAITAYLRAVDAGRVPLRSPRWLVVSCGCLLLSLFAKAWGMTCFVTLIALDVSPLARLPLSTEAFTDRRYRPIWIQKIPFVLLGAGAAIVAWLAQHHEPDTMVSIADWTWSARALQAAYGLCFYVWKTIWPARLAVLYARPNPLDGWPLAFPASVVLVTVAAILIVWNARRHPSVAMASLVYAATVAPVLGLAQSGPQLVADRYAYVSSLPFSALLTGALLARPRGRRSLAIAIISGCLLALAIVTWNATQVWHDSERLWGHALRVGESSYTAHLDYGQAVRANGRMDEAIEHYRMALALQPLSGNAWYNLANALKATGRLDEAERAYHAAIDHLSWKVEAQVNLGNLYFTRGRLADAIEQYRSATSTLAHASPAEFTPEPFLYLGIALADSGDRAGARDALTIAERYPATRARALQELRRLGT